MITSKLTGDSNYNAVCLEDVFRHLGEALSVKTLLEQNLVLASCSQGGLNERLEENPTEQR